jgi:hypothetical protein
VRKSICFRILGLAVLSVLFLTLKKFMFWEFKIDLNVDMKNFRFFPFKFLNLYASSSPSHLRHHFVVFKFILISEWVSLDEEELFRWYQNKAEKKGVESDIENTEETRIWDYEIIFTKSTYCVEYSIFLNSFVYWQIDHICWISSSFILLQYLSSLSKIIGFNFNFFKELPPLNYCSHHHFRSVVVWYI